MHSGLRLINWTRREYLLLADEATHPHASPPQRLDRNTIITTYLREHPGDWIASMEDTQSPWPFPDGDRRDLDFFTDVTADIIAAFRGMEEPAGTQLVYREDEYPTVVYIQRQRHVKPYPLLPAWPSRPDGGFLNDRTMDITYCLYTAFRMGIRLETADYGATWRLLFDQPWRPRPLFSQLRYDARDEPPASVWMENVARRGRSPAHRQSMEFIAVERPGQSWWTVDLPVATVKPLIVSLDTLVLPLFAPTVALSDAVQELTLRQGSTHHRLKWIGFDLPVEWESLAPLLQTLTDLVYDHLPYGERDHNVT
jgi:hypothetical protein